MSPAASTAATAPAPRRILAEHLELALVAARMRLSSPHLARFAATTGHPNYFGSCRPRTPWKAPVTHAHPGHNTPALLTMATGDIAKVIERTRLNHGRDEVRRTWGLGIRQLRALNLRRPA